MSKAWTSLPTTVQKPATQAGSSADARLDEADAANMHAVPDGPHPPRATS